MSSGLDNSYAHRGFKVPDPFAPRQKTGASFFNAILATALFRCWHILLLFTAWATLITALNNLKYKANFQVTLLTVIGTVLGFVISYRTTSSFERYNEGRRLWSQIILASRTFARTLWFHVPDPTPTGSQAEKEDARMRALIEKKTVINLLEAFAVSVKHYLRGEDGIYYKDLYYLVKFLPGYAFPAGRPSFNSEYSATDVNGRSGSPGQETKPGPSSGVQSSVVFGADPGLHQRSHTGYSTTKTLLPLPATSPTSPITPDRLTAGSEQERRRSLQGRDNVVLTRAEEEYLSPGYLPPKYHLLDLFPFSILVGWLTSRGNKTLKGKKAARLRAKLRTSVSHNIPLEISLYLSSYVAALQQRKSMDVPTTNTLLGALNQLVDALTGLERILTTPIPFSYSFHLWAVTGLYCLALPFQLWSTLGWLTIPGTTFASFVYFGFLVAGEEIENPFGYDKNDLNLDHFTDSIIRNELRALASAPPPDPAHWAFSAENDLVFAGDYEKEERIAPQDWLNRSYAAMLAALHADEPRSNEH
ncbi:Bestrophin, RFP-TM, chloride channel domain containing protein [Amanita muscaria]